MDQTLNVATKACLSRLDNVCLSLDPIGQIDEIPQLEAAHWRLQRRVIPDLRQWESGMQEAISWYDEKSKAIAIGLLEQTVKRVDEIEVCIEGRILFVRTPPWLQIPVFALTS